MICPHCDRETSTKYFKDGVGQCDKCHVIIEYDATKEWEEEDLLKKCEEKLRIICLLSPNLRHLLNKQFHYVKTKSYTENSAGYFIIKVLVQTERFTKQEISLILKKYDYEFHEKWVVNKNNDFTIEEMKNDDPDPSFEWLKIDMNKIIVYPGQKSFIEIVLNGGGTIELSEDEMLNANRFRQKYFINKGVMLAPISSNIWSFLLTEWQTIYGIKTSVEKVSSETEIKELILEYLRNAAPVTGDDKRKCLNYGYIYVEGDRVYLFTSIIKSIIKKNDIKIDVTKIRFVLKNYLIENSKVVKIDGHPKRFWVFDKRRLKIHEDFVEESLEEKMEALEKE